MNKFVIRRSVVSVLGAPIVATAYVLGYAVLVGLGAEPTTDVQGAWATGYEVAIAVGIVFSASAWVRK